MNETSTRWLRGLCAILALALLLAAAGGGLAVIGLRLREARVADAAQALEHDLAKAHSQLRSLTTAVAQAEELDALGARVAGKLVSVSERQIVWVRAAAPAMRESPPDAAPAPAFPFKVALVQPTVLLAQAP